MKPLVIGGNASIKFDSQTHKMSNVLRVDFAPGGMPWDFINKAEYIALIKHGIALYGLKVGEVFERPALPEDRPVFTTLDKLSPCCEVETYCSTNPSGQTIIRCSKCAIIVDHKLFNPVNPRVATKE